MYYIDSISFSTATAVYSDELLTTKAPDGFCKFETGYREQLNGLLLNNIQCTSCIDCKQFVSFSYKTATNNVNPITTVIGYTDCWGYNHVLTFSLDPTYGNFVTVPIDGPLCVKNNSAYFISGGAAGSFIYSTNSQCNIGTELVQSVLCTTGGSGSETPTGCDIDCTVIESLSYVYVQKTMSGYLENDIIVYNSNSTGAPFYGGDLYYKINYNNVVYGVKINNLGRISELTYCNP